MVAIVSRQVPFGSWQQSGSGSTIDALADQATTARRLVAARSCAGVPRIPFLTQ